MQKNISIVCNVFSDVVLSTGLGLEDKNWVLGLEGHAGLDFGLGLDYIAMFANLCQ